MCAVWMDLHESKKGSEKQSSSTETKRPPLVPADNKDGTTRRSRTREVSSRYKSPTPSAPKRCPSPNARRTSSISTAPVPKRAVSAERKRPSTPVRDSGVEIRASRKTAGNKLPESLWPSTMRSLSASFQSDTVSVSKKERTVSQRMPTPERKRSPLQGKNSTEQLQNSKSAMDQHLWPGRTSGKLSTSLNRSDVTDKMNKTAGSSHSRIVAPSSRRSSLDGISKTSSLSNSRTSTPSGRRLSLDRTSETSSLSDSRTSTPSGRRLSLDGTSKTSSLLESRTCAPSGRRLSLDGTSKASSLSEFRTSSPPRRRLSLDVTSETSSLSDSRTSTPSGRRLSLDGTSKTPSLSESRTSKPSGRRLSLDGTSKASSLPESRTSTPSGRRLSLHGTSKASSLSDSRTATTSERRLSLDGTSKASSLSESRTSAPSGRRSLDGTSKASSLTDSRMNTASGRGLSLDGTSKATSLMDSRMSTPSGRRLSLDGTSKASSLSGSRTCTPSGRRLSLDGASKPSQKSSNDLLLIISRDDNEKDSFTSSFDDDLLRIKRPSSSSSSSDRTSLVNGAARVQFVSRPTSISVSRAKGVYPSSSSRGSSPVRVRSSSPSRQPQNSTSVLSFIADIKQGRKTANNIEDVHQLRLLYNRHLQWRYANALRDAAFRSQKAKAEKILYRVSRIIADLCDSVKEKRCDLLQLKFKLKLYAVLDNQLTCLDEWASIESEHDNSLMLAIQDLEASTLRIPITGGAMVDIQTFGAAVCSAVEVMQAIGSSLCSTLAQVEERDNLVGELADMASHERAMLDECESLLSCTAALLVEEHSLRTQVLQMKQSFDY